jgi:gluconolactonase
MAFDLGSDGGVGRPRVLHNFGSGRGIDGMTVDRTGRIWATAGSGDKAGVYVFEPDSERQTAKLLTIVKTPEDPTNCTLGGPRRNILFITTANSLYRIATLAEGLPGLPGK